MSVVWTGYGAPAYAALRSAVAAAKRDDALRPVTVLVPSNLCGIVARRGLAAGLGGRAGVAGVSVLTVDRLAERLAAPLLAGRGRRPATDAVLAAAWRRALDESPGLFAPVAGHAATVRGLVAAHRELRDVDEPSLGAVAGSGDVVAADVVRLHRAVAALLESGWYDARDLRVAAVEVLRDRPQLGAEIGAVAVFLPQDLSVTAAALLAELSAAVGLWVVAGTTGDEQADAAVRRSLQRLGTGSQPPPKRPPVGRAEVTHASDADDEVRCTVRSVVMALRRYPAHRVAVLYTAAQPYARLLAEHLDTAGIAWSGASVRPTIERTLPRTLLDVLGLPERGWRRADVLGVLSTAPVRRPDGARVPAARWERISRIAGVVGGDDWDGRLKTYAAAERAAADRERAEPVLSRGRMLRRERDAAAADALAGFVAALKGRLADGASRHRWDELADWALDTFRLLHDDERAPRLPPEEARAADRIRTVLEGLRGLDAVGVPADLAGLRATLDLELGDDLPRHGKFGEGVLVAPLSAAVGLDADAVFLVGAAEDLLPGRVGADALLPDRVRAITGEQLVPLRERTDRRHRHLLAALAAAPDCTVSYPRGDLRRSTTRRPSRWLAALGEPVAGSPSYAASLARTAEPACGQEWRTRAAWAAGGGAGLLDALAGDQIVARAVAMLAGRAADRLTRFDGDLSGHPVPVPGSATPVSPTALEAWTRCPYGYLAGRLLWVEPVELPEERLQISPLDVGTLMHTALDRFFHELDGTAPAGAAPWTAGLRARLRAIATEVAADLTARGLTGHPLLWRQELARILTDLDQLLNEDQKVRRDSGRRQVHAELAFGMAGVAPVEVPLPGGGLVRLRGSADRVDQDGDAIVVVDYKTGSARDFTDLRNDPTAHGSKLQLPVYGYAARAAFGRPDAPVTAEYWFLRKDRGTRIGLTLTPDVERGYAHALDVITAGIGTGLFPHRPPDTDGWGEFVPCRYCDPDGLGAADHRSRWDRKRHDPRLAAYLALIEAGTVQRGQP